MYGFEFISEIAHDLESIFDLIRDHKKEFTKPIFEITLKTTDHFRNLLSDDKLESNKNRETHQLLLDSISEHVASNDDQKTYKHPEVSNNETLNNKQTFYIIFYPNESLLFRGINILRLFEDLTELGEYRMVNHAFKEHEANYSEHNAWGIYLATNKGIEGIEDVFMFVLNDCKILKISDNNLLNHADFISNLDAIDNKEQNQDVQVIQKDIEKTINTINSELKIEKENIPNSQFDVQTEATIENTATESTNTPIKDIGKDITSRISIDASKLDRLMYLVSELVITKSQLSLAVKKNDYSKLITIAEKIEDLSRNFRDNALSIRLVSVAEMIMPFKRLVRDLSKSLGKEIKFITQGADTELDKNIIDRLAEPVMHILRNSIDHGIETPDVRIANNKTPFGNIKFTSYYSGANVFIQIQDDGAGIDPEKIRQKAIEKGLINADDKLNEKDIYDLLFIPGFSTATRISEISGRGVGMDIVKKKIQEVRGEVDINSELGLGTFITIKLHQTLSIIDTLLIQVDDVHYLIPIADIELCDQKSHKNLYKNQNRQVEIENDLIPFVSIRDIFNYNTNYPEKEKLIIISKNENRIAIVADKIIGEHQAVLKPLGEVFQSQQYLSGASILGDGSLALMLDINKLADKTNSKYQN